MMNKYREGFLYLLFGALTTLINILSYNLLYYGINVPNVPANIIAWVLSVAFAYITNKLWVFESKETNVAKEALSFFAARLSTGILDVLIMFVFVDLLMQSGGIIKILSNILVIILNYILSKLWVFKK